MYHDLFNYVKKMYLIVLITIDIICHKCNINSVRNGDKNEIQIRTYRKPN